MLGRVVPLVAIAGMLVGCSGGTRTFVSADPLNDVVNPSLTSRERVSVVSQFPSLIEDGTLGRESAIERLKAVAWAREVVPTEREAAMIVLLGETALLDDSEAVSFVAQILPTEPQASIARYLVGQAALNGWRELTPAIVRRFARPDASTADTRRPEYAALQALHPERDVEETVFQVFRESGGLDDSGRLRRDAWNLLSRLDASGDIRVNLLGGLARSQEQEDDPTLDALRRALLELRTIPLTGQELEWLVQLASRENADWWQSVNVIVRTLDAPQQRGLRLRHMEPLRWASTFRRDWTRMSKGALLDVLEDQLDAETLHRRRAGAVASENLESWRDRLSFGDAVTLRVVSEAIREPRVIAALFDQAEEDRADTTTEYGGVLRLAQNRTSRGMFTAVSYPPRASIREGDTSFVASRELIDESATSLAHYHLHAQRVRNSQYAGPSDGDLNYASLYGRTCIVFTTVSEDEMNADAFFPSGAVIDLGTLRRSEGR